MMPNSTAMTVLDAVTACKKVKYALTDTSLTIGDPSVSRSKSIFVTGLDEMMSVDEVRTIIINNNPLLGPKD